MLARGGHVKNSVLNATPHPELIYLGPHRPYVRHTQCHSELLEKVERDGQPRRLLHGKAVDASANGTVAADCLVIDQPPLSHRCQYSANAIVGSGSERGRR